MRRKEQTRQVVIYQISPSENEQAIRDFINGRADEGGGHCGFIPEPDDHGVMKVEYSLDDDGGATVMVIYQGDK